METLRKHLENELRASSNTREFEGGEEPYAGADEDVKKVIKENFELKFGLIAPVPETINRLITDFYKSQGYSQQIMPIDMLRGERGIIEDQMIDAHNYLFGKEDSLICVRMTALPSGNGLLASVFSN